MEWVKIDNSPIRTIDDWYQALDRCRNSFTTLDGFNRSGVDIKRTYLLVWKRCCYVLKIGIMNGYISAEKGNELMKKYDPDRKEFTRSLKF